MARPPIVGITAYGREAGPRGEQFSLPTAYVAAVRAAGGVPVLLPPDEDSVEHALEAVDALVFAGGGDIDPAFTGGAHETNYSVDAERDRFEVALMEAALAAEVPTLAICRGLQILNVARGGSLHAHLPEVFGDAVDHRVAPLDPVPHDVTLEPGTALETLYAAGEMRIASWHHQAVDRLGADLRAVAWAPDGVVEALELSGAPWLVAVQWHPELQQEPGSLQRLPFVEVVRQGASRTR
ncbi:MAG: gamma-glutamyl-gamma-aminobutyrate hydrolase family protein [Myxococcales bacterium]|nr:gamma-glutamyl-gamma-aminobutyrate hydrolase family protein [Myxococcales bacterium]